MRRGGESPPTMRSRVVWYRYAIGYRSVRYGVVNWNLAKEMLNAECKMLNEGVRFADRILNHFRKKYLILHFAFYIQHSGSSQINANLPLCCVMPISTIHFLNC